MTVELGETISHYSALVSVSVVTGDLPDDLAELLRRADRVAVDTETSGLDWRHDELELCQLFTPASGSVLIRRSEAHPTNLLSLLGDPRLLKVFHYAPFDLRFLESTWRVRTSPVFCTKAASKLLDPQLLPEEHSLGSLLSRHFGIRLDKGQVRVSDWGAPDLTPEQVTYAAGDVMNLLQLAELEDAELHTRGLEADFRAICDYMPVSAHLEIAGIPDPLSY